MIRPDHCTAPPGQECWECYQPGQDRASERSIRRALSLVAARALRCTLTTESIAKLEWALHILRDRSNRQWREMVRNPFHFPKPEKSQRDSATSRQAAAPQPELDML